MSGIRAITRVQDADDYAALQDPAAATKGLRSLGTGAQQAAAGNDSRLSDARTPTGHASSHQNGGADEVATATAAANAIPKAGAGGRLARGWLPAGVVADDTIWDVKGDLAVGSASDAASRLAVGSNGQVLTADSAQTLGVKWATPASGAVATDTIWDAAGDLAQGTGADTAARLARGTSLTDRIIVNGTSLAWVPHVVRRSSDSAAKTNNTLAADDTLLWAVAANEVWFFQAWLLVQAANTTMDSLFGWSVPSGTTMSWGGSGSAGSSQGGYQDITTGGTPGAMLGAAGTLAVGTGNQTQGVGLAGVVVASSTAGNVNLTWAQNTTDAGNLKMLANSILLLWRLA